MAARFSSDGAPSSKAVFEVPALPSGRNINHEIALSICGPLPYKGFQRFPSLFGINAVARVFLGNDVVQYSDSRFFDKEIFEVFQDA